MSNAHKDLVETRIDVAELAIGMHVIRLDKPWEDSNFLLQGFVIRHESEIHAIQSQCNFVTIEGQVDAQPHPRSGPSSSPRGRGVLGLFKRNKKQPPSEPGSPQHVPRRRVTYINKVDAGSEMTNAVMQFKEAQQTAKSIMSGLRVGRTLDLNNARAVVNNCVDSVLRNENALLLLTKIKNQDEYTAEHCINVSILAAAFGKHEGLLEGEIRNLALCGLLHDVGKTQIPDEVLNKPGALTPDEFGVMRQHTTHGRTILMGTSSSLNTAVDVAFSHHERMDGDGYPRGLQAHQIPYFAKIIGLVDTYDAITSTRVYDTGRASMQALEVIHKHRGSQFDGELADAFIQMIGIYPPGSIVEMKNGEVAIVMESDPYQKLKPKVLLVREADKTIKESYQSLDLKASPLDAAGNSYQISREVPDGMYDITLQDFVNEGLIGTAPTPQKDET